MNSYERVMTAVQGQEPDRVPIMENHIAPQVLQALMPGTTTQPEFAEAFDASVRAVFGALDEGSLFPRLVKPDTDVEPSRCQGCAVKEACLRGDSGARARLVAWAAQPPRKGLSPAERALLRLWAVAGGGGEAS